MGKFVKLEDIPSELEEAFLHAAKFAEKNAVINFLGRKYSVMTLPHASAERFAKASEHLRRIKVGAPKVLAFWEERISSFMRKSVILCEFVDKNNTLKDLMDKHNVSVIAHFITKIARTLRKMHDSGLFHGNFRPTNIWLEDDKIFVAGLERAKILRKVGAIKRAKDISRIGMRRKALDYLLQTYLDDGRSKYSIKHMGIFKFLIAVTK